MWEYFCLWRRRTPAERLGFLISTHLQNILKYFIILIIMKDKKDNTLLLVDDDKAFRDIVRYDLEVAGYKNIFEAENGIEALDCVAEKHVDLMLLDLRMPKLDGEVVLRTVKENYRNISVIVVTGQIGSDVKKAVLALGADGYIEKPYETVELLGSIDKVLGMK
jgi:CheY-like chemotaxis protein